MLADSHSEVQGMAMKCLAPLTAFIDLQNAVYVVDKLLDHVLDTNPARSRSGASEIVGQKAARDVASLGLKAIIHEIKPASAKATTLSVTVLPRLVRLISSTAATSDATDTLIDSLELLLELITRLGHIINDHHKQITDALFRHFTAKSPLIRKRAITSLAALAAICDKSIFAIIVERTLSDLQNPSSHESVRTGVQAVSALSKSAGHRLGSHLHVLAPILFNYLSSNKYVSDDEFREHCLQALEYFCLRCRREMLPFASTFAEIVVGLAKYDPNYEDDDESPEDDNTDDMAEEDDMDDEYDDEDYSDDDDSSWKVRRAAIRCIHAAVSDQILSPRELCIAFGPFLVSRFKEREETVKIDVFAAFVELLRQCTDRSMEDVVVPSTPGRQPVFSGVDLMAVDDIREPASHFEPLASRGPQIIRTLKKELGARSLKVRIKAMGLAKEIVSALPALAPTLLEKSLNEVRHALGDSPASMKTETLLFLRTILKRSGAASMAEHLDNLFPRLLSSLEDRYYKVTSECLRFFSESMLSFGSSPQVKSSLTKHVPAMQDAALRRATAQDQDSEVKDSAMFCLGAGVARFGSDLGVERLGATADIMRDRLRNEVTRTSTVRALHLIATSESADTLSHVMDDIVRTVTGFLRKNDLTLRFAAIELLSAAPNLPPSNDALLISNLSSLICDSDLRLACVALQLTTKLLKERGTQGIALATQEDSIYHRSLALTISPLLQGRAVDALLELFGTLAHINAEPVTIQQMLQALEQQAAAVSFSITASSARGSPLYCIAKCIVAVIRAAETNLRIQTTQQIIRNIESSDFKAKIFALACLGEFGRGSLLPREGEEKEVVQNAILYALDARVEEVKAAAAVSLGGLASADSSSGVPALIDLIRQRPGQRYLLLLSLKEAIGSTGSSDVDSVVPLALKLLLEESTHDSDMDASANEQWQSSEEESIRSVTAECLGLLVQASPESVLRALTDAVSVGSASIRASAVSGVKFAVSSGVTGNAALSTHLRNVTGTFIQLIGDKDVSVAKNAVQAVNAIAKSRPSVLLPHIAVATSLIYPRTAKDKELVRIVDLGPFKHEEDYGLDLRKSAFDCLRTFVSGPLCVSIPVVTLLEHVVIGLRDQGDVRAIAQLILVATAGTEAAPQMVNVMDAIVRALEATFNERVKENAVRQEVEKYEDSILGALRAVRAMERVPEIASNRAFMMLMSNVVRSSRYQEKYADIVKSEAGILQVGVTGQGNERGHIGRADRMEE